MKIPGTTSVVNTSLPSYLALEQLACVAGARPMVMYVVMYVVTANCISSAVALNSVASLTNLTV